MIINLNFSIFFSTRAVRTFTTLLTLILLSTSSAFAAPATKEPAKTNLEKSEGKKDASEAKAPDVADKISKESFELNEKGVAQIKNRDFVGAESTFRKALAADEKNITAAFNLASVLLVNKKEAAAIVLLNDYVKREPGDAGLQVRLGDAYFGSKDVKKASAAYEKALALDPEYPELLSKISTIYILTNRNQEAEKYLDMAAAQNPKDPKILANLSAVYLGNGKADKAIAAAKRSLQLEPNKDVYITLATAYETLKDYKNSLIAFQRAADLGDTRDEVQKKIEGLKKVVS